ncbi:winged helix-turn-helix transcriptional regulator [Cyclobacterium salsum]|uniref:winged helix-turn-helix transcriptional regulator n=1 Tax=Cyclobacterium salsum TaxID=2666329 RepID=UPI001391B727|nr:helix-turn-helix domain-containing protein [Cyclobacterium salsum]
MKSIRITNRCPIRTTLELVGGKWKLLILFQLMEKPLRLSELKKQIPDISEKMLIQELKTLVESGLAIRRNFGEVPPRVEYSLTDTGRAVLPLIEEMRHFALFYEEKMVKKG